MRYFKKALVSNRLSLPSGRPVKFEIIGDSDTGVLETEDAGLISELEKAIAAERGGVTEVTEVVYQEIKKNPPAGRSRIKSLDAQSVRTLLDIKNEGARDAKAKARVATANQPSAPMEVPKGLVTVSKMKRMKDLVGQQAAAGVGG